MNKLLIVLLVLTSFVSCQQDKMEAPSVSSGTKTIGANPKADYLQQLLKKHIANGIPGAVIAIKDANGLWVGAEGYAKLEDKTPMSPEMAHYGFSITKVVTAVAIMQLKEKGLLNLDLPIRTYLPTNLYSLVPKSETITVRMLLNHTSGYSDITQQTSYRLHWLDNPLKVWKREEYYELMRKTVTIQNTPGSIFNYSNTNYFLLSIIIDHITGKPHGEWYQKHIFDRLDLGQMFYKDAKQYPFYNNMPNTYWSRFGNNTLENNTRMQRAYMQNEIYGEDGLIATPDNYIRMMEGLVNGQLVSAASLDEMKEWIQNPGSTEPDYGLGLVYVGYKNKPNFGHNGIGIGSYSLCLYFPGDQTYLYVALNVSPEFGGPVEQKIYSFINEVGNYLAEY
jgi:D-alanyl-D-alanine carboxypeptidase